MASYDILVDDPFYTVDSADCDVDGLVEADSDESWGWQH